MMGFVMSASCTENRSQSCLSNGLDKVDITCVLVYRLTTLPAKAKVASLRAASEVLENWANCITDSGHALCDIEIVFEDGCRYNERYDLMRSQKRVSLSRHVRRQLVVAATTGDDKKLSQEYCLPVIGLIGANLAESARLLLEKYEIKRRPKGMKMSGSLFPTCECANLAFGSAHRFLEMLYLDCRFSAE